MSEENNTESAAQETSPVQSGDAFDSALQWASSVLTAPTDKEPDVVSDVQEDAEKPDDSSEGEESDVAEEDTNTEDEVGEEQQEKPQKGAGARIEKLSREKREALEVAENYRKQIESYERRVANLEETIGLIKGETPTKQKDDPDAVLQQYGIDPEGFLDDETKLKTVENLKKIGKIDAIEQRQQQESVMRSIEQDLYSLPDSEREQVIAALDHVIGVDARQRMMNSRRMHGREMSEAEAIRQAQDAFRQTAIQLHSRNIHPLVWAYENAQALGLQPKPKPTPEKAKIDPKAVEALRQKTEVADSDSQILVKRGAPKDPFAEMAKDPRFADFAYHTAS